MFALPHCDTADLTEGEPSPAFSLLSSSAPGGKFDLLTDPKPLNSGTAVCCGSETGISIGVSLFASNAGLLLGATGLSFIGLGPDIAEVEVVEDERALDDAELGTTVLRNGVEGFSMGGFGFEVVGVPRERSSVACSAGFSGKVDGFCSEAIIMEAADPGRALDFGSWVASLSTAATSTVVWAIAIGSGVLCAKDSDSGAGAVEEAASDSLTAPFRFFGPLARPLRMSCNCAPSDGSLGALSREITARSTAVEGSDVVD